MECRNGTREIDRHMHTNSAKNTTGRFGIADRNGKQKIGTNSPKSSYSDFV
jgi:hypothetical protein